MNISIVPSYYKDERLSGCDAYCHKLIQNSLKSFENYIAEHFEEKGAFSWLAKNANIKGEFVYKDSWDYIYIDIESEKPCFLQKDQFDNFIDKFLYSFLLNLHAFICADNEEITEENVNEQCEYYLDWQNNLRIECNILCLTVVVKANIISYHDYLRTKKWIKKRNECLRLSDFKCQRCGSGKKLQVHHLTYDRIGNEDQNDLVALCAACHSAQHN